MSHFETAVLVDDNADDVFIHRRFIELSNFARSVVEYLDSREALAALLDERERAPDILFVDLNMPGVSGFDLLEAIAGSEHLTDVHVVVLTSSLHPADRVRAEATGVVDAYVQKPLDLATLGTLAQTLRSAER